VEVAVCTFVTGIVKSLKQEDMEIQQATAMDSNHHSSLLLPFATNNLTQGMHNID